MSFHYLEHLFSPRSVAVIGASERTGSLGRIAFDNLRSGGYAGELIAVNPKYQSVAGVACHAGQGGALGRVIAGRRQRRVSLPAN